MLGGNVFGWTADAATAFTLIDAFLDGGFNAIDTADGYSSWVPGHVGGESETVIGEWLQARGGRERIVLASKVGMKPKAHISTEWDRDLSAAHIVQAIEGSLRRLKTEYVDLYQVHADDLDTPLDETLRAFEQLIESGKVRVIGASHYDPARLSQALDVSRDSALVRYATLQVRYNLFDRAELEGKLQALCRQQDVSVLCYSALAKGYLSGKYRTAEQTAASQWATQLRPYQTDRGAQLLNALDAIALEQGCSPAQIALVWLMDQPGVAAPIVSVNTMDELNEIMGAARVKLEPDQLAALSATGASPP